MSSSVSKKQVSQVNIFSCVHNAARSNYEKPKLYIIIITKHSHLKTLYHQVNPLFQRTYLMRCLKYRPCKNKNVPDEKYMYLSSGIYLIHRIRG